MAMQCVYVAERCAGRLLYKVVSEKVDTPELEVGRKLELERVITGPKLLHNISSATAFKLQCDLLTDHSSRHRLGSTTRLSIA